ncbi:hypothetical protein QJS10_CPB18g00808 [Acorus calamus]|uniref:Plant thionin family protein n=1 Tax=Acorus calamus TaxID=4465 RepID=A0AAV9CP02_ACOCL|nr:hypothetical protein QJS10_CPB18g00808 [Acorus calamus]
MTSGKLAAVILVSMLVVMALVEVSEARNCFDDCMGQCMPIKYATRPQCESQCDQACKSIGEPGKPGHHH